MVSSRYSTAALRSFEVVLTTACNLNCSYCFQTARRKSTLSWDNLRAAIAQVLESQNVVTDAGVAVMAAYAALKSAALNVYINIGSLKDVSANS